MKSEEILEGIKQAISKSAWSDVCTSKSEMRDVVDLIEGLQAALPKWVSVEDGKPEKNVNVLFWQDDEYDARIGSHDGERWRDYDAHCDPENVTHWMPLPEGPGDE